MTTPTLAHPDTDLRRRVRPSREQLRVAAAIFTAATEDVTSVVVPIVVPGSDGGHVSERSFEYPGGYWLADRGSPEGAYSFRVARDAAAAAAEAHLRTRGRRGVPGWVSIRPDGTWAVGDGLASAAS